MSILDTVEGRIDAIKKTRDIKPYLEKNLPSLEDVNDILKKYIGDLLQLENIIALHQEQSDSKKSLLEILQS